MPFPVTHRGVRTVPANATILSGSVTFGAAGAISAQSDNRESGVTIMKNATGDYRANIARGFKRVRGCGADTVAPAAATAKSLTTGTEAYMQGVSAANFAGTSPISSFAIAIVRPDTGVLADPVNGQTVTWWLIVSDS
jgi:hypothetical protein